MSLIDELKLTDEEVSAITNALLNDKDIQPAIRHSVRKKYLALRNAGFYHTAAVVNGALEKLEGRSAT